MSDEVTIPDDITPRDFYQRFLPDLYAKRGPQVALAGWTGSLRVVVTGDGGGTWSLKMIDGVFSVARGPEANPTVTITQTREDWQVSITKGIGKLLTKIGENKVGSAGAVAPAIGGMPAPSFSVEKLTKMSTTKGSFHFDITGYEGGRTIRCSFEFNSTEKPNFVVAISADNYRAMTTGQLPPQQAFMQGKIQISGDVPFAMQLGMQMLAP